MEIIYLDILIMITGEILQRQRRKVKHKSNSMPLDLCIWFQHHRNQMHGVVNVLEKNKRKILISTLYSS